MIRSEIVPPRHQLQRKRQKKVHDYYQKSIDDFKIIIVNLSPKLPGQEKRTISTSFGYSSQDQRTETNTKRITAHVLNCWSENKSISHPGTFTLTPSETVDLKIYSIEIK